MSDSRALDSDEHAAAPLNVSDKFQHQTVRPQTQPVRARQNTGITTIHARPSRRIRQKGYLPKHPMKTEIIIPVHNALEHTRKCIASLYAHTANFKLIIVDDLSDEATREFLYGPEVLGRDASNLYVRTNSQRWFSRASNIGLRLARTDWPVLLNSDCEVDNGWLEEMCAVRDEWLQSNPAHRLGLVGSTLSGEEQRRWRDARHPDYVTGHCWLMNMEAFTDLANGRGTPRSYFNELDPGQIHISSDRIACWDLNQRGWATIASHKAAVGHHGGKSWGHNMYSVARLRIDPSDSGEIIV
jgi:hypothetical protein